MHSVSKGPDERTLVCTIPDVTGTKNVSVSKTNRELRNAAEVQENGGTTRCGIPVFVIQRVANV